jgi:CDP-paratose 2-epimerase
VSAGCTVLISGGAGFVGTNLAARLIENGERVRILDSLARAGSERNLSWLKETYGERIEFVRADIRNVGSVRAAVAGVEHVVHLAAQVAVTSSLVDPPFDFDVNAVGTINLLEAIRARPQPPSLLFTSTNKVYGALENLALRVDGSSYVPMDQRIAKQGVCERQPLDFHSPYGCSKGAADQYVLDYARSYGLQTTVFRMSCIYGPHQYGNEDQGWVAHMARSALEQKPITIYGDGLQVRDVLFVGDLLDAFTRARECMPWLAGKAFNIGGGPANATSVLDLIGRLEMRLNRRIQLSLGPWRVGDQRYYVSDISRFCTATGWHPKTSMTDGVAQLCDWLETAEHLMTPPMQPAMSSMALLAAHE